MKTLPLALGLAGLAAASVVATLQIRAAASHRALVSELAAARARGAALDRQLAAASAQSGSLEQRLTELDVDLGATKTRLTSTDARNLLLTRELARARADVASHTQSEQRLHDELAALSRDRPMSGPVSSSSEDVAAYQTVIADLERQLATARQAGAAPGVVATPPTPPAPAPKPDASVVGVGPANAFVILDYGAGRGVMTGQSFAIRRGRETLAVAQVTDVRPRFSIAHVRPNSLRGVLQKGDSAVLTD